MEAYATGANEVVRGLARGFPATPEQGAREDRESGQVRRRDGGGPTAFLPTTTAVEVVQDAGTEGSTFPLLVTAASASKVGNVAIA